ncbi:TPA: Exc2 family lipoprotein [Enterobacter hormaechei subsp. xiangfangensis]|nr:Exc2 family lipoprotein [Enterobacter hormaechei subsp. xiangfangensis]
MKRVILASLVALVATGCAPKTSPEQHAKHYAFHADESSNPTFKVDRNGVYQMNLEKFKQVYAHGKDDRAAGTPRDVALLRAKLVYDAAYNANMKSDYLNHKGQEVIEESSKNDSRVFAEEISAAYLDGYDGK